MLGEIFMFDFIVIVFIIYVIYKKYNNNSQLKLITILQNKGFQNISTIKSLPSSTWITATLHGDNYLFELMKNGNSVTNSSITILVEYATKEHYHNIILVPGNTIISNSAKAEIKKYNIQVWDSSQLINFSNTTSENIASFVKPKITDDTCKILEPDDPIQDGAKANSIWDNLFKHKIERL